MIQDDPVQGVNGSSPSGISSRIHESQRGSMLLIALAVLTLLSIIAVTFVALMRLELKATENFRDKSRAQLLSKSAESAVISMLRSRPFWDMPRLMNRTNAPWIYGLVGGNGFSREGGLLSLKESDGDESSLASNLSNPSYPGVNSADPGEDRFKTKLIDTSGQIYLNGEQDTLAQILTNLGRALDGNDRYGVNPLWTGPNETGRQISGEEIVKYRNRLPDRRFSSKSELAALIGRENLALISDFVTAHAYVNPYTYRSSAALPVVNTFDSGNRGGQNIGTTGINRGNDPRDIQAQSVVGATQLTAEPRAPININTASEPVLTAILTGLGGRRAFPFMRISKQSLESGNAGSIDLGGGTLAPVKEELAIQQTPVWVYSQPLGLEQARNIARSIISQRRDRGPFRTWTASNSSNEVGFEDFVNNLPANIFPPPSSVYVVNPQSNQTSNFYGEMIGADGSRELWQRGVPNSERGLRRQFSLPADGNNAWYYEMMRSILVANANPNTRINKVNPNRPSYRAVDKSGLVKLAGADNGSPNAGDVRLGHTTEFCFDSKGIYEITSLAEITGTGQGKEVFSEAVSRSVVKVFDVYHHTTQEQFEQPFRAVQKSSLASRENITTWPDPIDALQPEFYTGSDKDGRVEITGKIDAEIAATNPATRGTRWLSNPTLRLAHTFRFRDEQSTRTLRNLLRSPSNPEAKIRELGKVLDADYAQKGSTYKKRYSSYTWGAQDSALEEENIPEVLIDEAGQNSDIMPDGLNSSIFRTSALGGRFLRLPAMIFRQTPADQGAVGRNYNNDVGNLPYYNGAVSFWIKLEFNGDDPTFSGLLGATQVQTPVGQSPQDSEGSQFWIWKNTEGQLRISRLYYHQAFAKGYTSQAIPLIGNEDDEESGAEEAETDEQKFWARTDVVVNVSNWRAHEWHHVAVSYDDQSATNRIRVWVDHENTDAVNHNIGEGMFCALNEEEPKDQIMIGGFYRDQAVATEGLFKFGTNFTRQGVQTAPSIKRVLANATIDEFRVYLGQYTQDDSRKGGYYTERPAKYANVFMVPFEEGIQRRKLRNMTWTVYSPKIYSGASVQFDEPVMTVLNVNGQATARTLQDPGGKAGGDGGGRSNLQLAGKYLYATGSQDYGSDFDLGFLGYEIQMRAGTAQGGALSGRTMVSPALDDVTLSVYLPSARYLISEVLE
jgi:hypothetical protein